MQCFPRPAVPAFDCWRSERRQFRWYRRWILCFLGVTEQPGVWSQRCTACGQCILDRTGGICPITRCAKGLLNGPCGGTQHGKCEVDSSKDCAWTLIYRRLEKLGQLHQLEKIWPPRDFNRVVQPARYVWHGTAEAEESP